MSRQVTDEEGKIAICTCINDLDSQTTETALKAQQ